MANSALTRNRGNIGTAIAYNCGDRGEDWRKAGGRGARTATTETVDDCCRCSAGRINAGDWTLGRTIWEQREKAWEERNLSGLKVWKGMDLRRQEKGKRYGEKIEKMHCKFCLCHLFSFCSYDWVEIILNWRLGYGKWGWRIYIFDALMWGFEFSSLIIQKGIMSENQKKRLFVTLRSDRCKPERPTIWD